MGELSGLLVIRWVTLPIIIKICGLHITLLSLMVYNCSKLMQDNKDLYAEEAAAQRERERQRMLSIPGLIAPNEIQDEMLDS